MSAIPVIPNEPALTIGVVAAAIVAILSLFHVVADIGTVTTILAMVAPIVASIITRTQVSPVKTVRR